MLETFFDDRLNVHEHLAAEGEVSHANTTASDLSKLFVIASASSFEARVSDFIASLYSEQNTPDLRAFVMNKALKRQFHSLFDWNASNANQLFGLFGNECKKRATEKRAADPSFKAGEEAFMRIGSERNLIVHGNYAFTSTSLTPAEVVALHKHAEYFLQELASVVGV